MALNLLTVFLTFRIVLGSDDDDDEISSCATYHSKSDDRRCHVAETLLAAEADLLASSITNNTLTIFLEIHQVLMQSIKGFEGAFYLRFDVLRHCMRVIVAKDLVQGASNHPVMRLTYDINLSATISTGWSSKGKKNGTRRRQSKNVSKQKLNHTQVDEFVVDIFEFMKQSCDNVLISSLIKIVERLRRSTALRIGKVDSLYRMQIAYDKFDLSNQQNRRVFLLFSRQLNTYDQFQQVQRVIQQYGTDQERCKYLIGYVPAE